MDSRHNGGNTADVTAQIATDANFADIVGSFSGSADAANDSTVKLKATGLTSNTRYYYRFVAPDGVISKSGQFKTAPLSDQISPISAIRCTKPKTPALPRCRQ